MRGLSNLQDNCIESYLRMMQIEHWRAKERGRIILRGYRELLSELTRVLFYERRIRNQCIYNNKITLPTKYLISYKLRSAHFRTYGFSDYYLNQIFFNTSDAGKKTNENSRSRLIDEKDSQLVAIQSYQLKFVIRINQKFKYNI